MVYTLKGINELIDNHMQALEAYNEDVFEMSATERVVMLHMLLESTTSIFNFDRERTDLILSTLAEKFDQLPESVQNVMQVYSNKEI